MSKVKVYEWRGVSSLSLSLNIDGRKRDIDFPPGKEKPRVNARYECAEVAVQEKIEATSLFKTGKIKIFREYEIFAPVAAGAEVNAPTATEVKEVKKPAPGKGVYLSVTNYQQAAAKLHEKFAVPMDQLQDPDTIMSEAAKYGASFPNLIS